MLVVVSALKAEIQTLIDVSRAELLGKNRWLQKDMKVLMAPLGVGYLEAAIKLQKLLLDFPSARGVLFCGSAGVYPGVQGIETGDLCWCRDVVLADGAAELGLSAYASVLPRGAIASTLETDVVLESARMVTSLTLTLDDALAETIARGARGELENMEIYGIAAVCLQNSTEWNALTAVTNIVGKNGSRDWKKNYRRLADKACEYLYGFLRSGVQDSTTTIF